MRTNLGQAEDRKRTYEGPHRQKVQFYQSFCVVFAKSIVISISIGETSESPVQLIGKHQNNEMSSRTLLQYTIW